MVSRKSNKGGPMCQSATIPDKTQTFGPPKLSLMWEYMRSYRIDWHNDVNNRRVTRNGTRHTSNMFLSYVVKAHHIRTGFCFP